MRLPFPVRFPIWHVCLFAGVLSFVQIAQGTKPLFSVYCFLFIVVSAIAFNTAGGLSKPSGSFIFFFSILTVVVGVCVKAVLGEPADSNLIVPLLTMKVYLGSALSLLIAAFMTRRLSSKQGKLKDILPLDQMNIAATGCLAIGILLEFAPRYLAGGNGSFISAITQINRFLPMALILGVTYQVRKSGGRSSTNPTVLIAFAFLFVFEGLLGLSKQAVFLPIFAWFICSAAMRLRVSIMQAAGGTLAFLFVFYYIVPYVQYTRTVIQESGGDYWDARLHYLEDLGETRRLYQENEKWNNEAARYHYFSTPTGFFDRLQMLAVDDALISITDTEHPFGLAPLWGSILNVIPHVLWPAKPTFPGGNTFAHELRIVSAEDDTTGISFSPASDAFHEAGWTGVFLILPILAITLFITVDSICGDTRESPWSLLVAAFFAHIAPEGMLGGMVSFLSIGLLGVLFVASLSAYILPVVGRMFTGGDKSMVPFRNVGSVPGTVRRLSPANPLPRPQA